jgi:hypothetical protein
MNVTDFKSLEQDAGEKPVPTFSSYSRNEMPVSDRIRGFAHPGPETRHAKRARVETAKIQSATVWADFAAKSTFARHRGTLLIGSSASQPAILAKIKSA